MLSVFLCRPIINTTSFVNPLAFVSYSPVWVGAAAYYDTDPNNLYWIGNMYYITFFVFGPAFIPLLERRLEICLNIAALLTAIGSWIIWIGGSNFTLCLLGVFFVGVAEALFLGVPVCINICYFRSFRSLVYSL